MKVAILTTDNRDHYKDYSTPTPHFGTAPEALLQGLEDIPRVEVHIVSCTREPTKSPERLGPNVFFHGLHVPKWGWIRTGYQGCIRATRAKLRQIHPDIVHGQGTERDCAISAVFSGYPNVLTLHGVMGHMARALRSPVGSYMWLSAQLEKLVLRRTAGVFCNSEHTERFVAPYAKRRWRVPNAVRRQFFSTLQPPLPAGRPRILNIGVISTYKRQNELLDSLLELRKQGLDFELVFAGQANPSNPYAAKFLERMEQPGIQEFVRYVGLKPTSELIQLMDDSAALIHVPLEEAFGLVVAEAFTRGLKLFASSVGGVPDIAAGVPRAELFPLEDLSGLSRAVKRWLQSGASRSPEAVLLMPSRYSPEVIARRHLQIYEDVLGRRG
jgi:glycosyltransferase involved in cell wall biosynthesis